MVERRRYERIRCDLRIRWRSERLAFEGFILDISPGGVFIITSRPPPVRSILDIDLLFEDGSTVECRGKVTWLNNGQVPFYPPGMGVEFLDLAKELHDRLVLEGVGVG